MAHPVLRLLALLPLHPQSACPTQQPAATTVVVRAKEALAWSQEFQAPRGGRLHAWVAASKLSPTLSLLDAQGRTLAEDRESGGRTTPCIVRDVRDGERVTLWLRGETTAAECRLEVHVAFAGEPVEADLALRALESDFKRVRTTQDGGDAVAAKKSCAALVSALLKRAEAKVTARDADLAFDTAFLGLQLGLHEDAASRDRLVECARLADDSRGQWLPSAHAGRYRARGRLGTVLGYAGYASESCAALESAVAWLRDDPNRCWTLEFAYVSNLAHGYLTAKKPEPAWRALDSIDAGRYGDKFGDREGWTVLGEWLINAAEALKQLGRDGKTIELFGSLPVQLERFASQLDEVSIKLRYAYAEAHRAQGNYQPASEQYARLTKLLGGYCGDGWNETRLSAKQLRAACLADSGSRADAETLIAGCLSDAEELRLGAESGVGRAVRTSAAQLLEKMGRHNEALAILRTVPEGPLLDKHGLLVDGEVTLRIARATCLLGDARGAAARRLLEDTLNALESRSSGSAAHIDTLRTNLAVLCEEVGDHARAAVLREDALRRRIELVRRDASVKVDADATVMWLRAALSTSYYQMARYTDAVKIADQALAHLDPKEQSQHGHWLRAARAAAAALRALGEQNVDAKALDEAIARFRAALATGLSRADERALSLSLSNALEARGRFADALAVLDGNSPYRLDKPDTADLKQLIDWNVNRAWLFLRGAPVLGERRSEVDLALTDALEAERAWLCRAGREQGPVGAGKAASEAQATLATLWSAALCHGADATLLGKTVAAMTSARSLSTELMRELRLRAHDPAFVELRKKRDVAQAALRAALLEDASETEIRRHRNEVENLDSQLAPSPKDLAALLVTDCDTIAAGLTADEAVAIYLSDLRWRISANGQVTRANETEAYLLRRGSAPQRVELGATAELEALVQGWSLAAQGDAPWAGGRAVMDPYHNHGVRLRERIVDPVLPHLDGIKRVHVVSHNSLSSVCFDALPARAEQGKKTLVGDSRRFVHRVSLLELARRGKARADRSAQGLVAIGGVDYGSRSKELEQKAGSVPWDYLEGSEDEVAQIAKLRQKLATPPEPVPLVIGKERATVEAFLSAAPHARYLHLATHAFFDPGRVPGMPVEFAVDSAVAVRSMRDPRAEALANNPLLAAGLVLAGANLGAFASGVPRGILEGESLAVLDLSGCDLAVLSACQTGRGLASPYMQFAGLRSALYAGGVRSTVTTEWRIADRDAQEFMTAFYGRMWGEHLAVGEALWRTQRAFADLGRSPRAWAGWILTGEP